MRCRRPRPNSTAPMHIVVLSRKFPDRILLARKAMPVVVGLGIGENFVASDVAALLPVTRRFIFLKDGDVADVRKNEVRVIDEDGNDVERPVSESEMTADIADKGGYRHFMLKEIHEQPDRCSAYARGTDQRTAVCTMPRSARARPRYSSRRNSCISSPAAPVTMPVPSPVTSSNRSAACPVTSRSPASTGIAVPVVPDNTLFVTISQSGETADTLAALQLAKESGYLATLAICNVPESILVRESDLVMLTRAGPEIGVASTKAFTTQLAALSLLVIAAGNAPR